MESIRSFNAYQHEVRDILLGKQTQFRRLFRFPEWALEYRPEYELSYLLNARGNGRVGLSRDGRKYKWFSCGYELGGYLYVRETFWAKHATDGGGEEQFCDWGPSLELEADFHPGIQYCATPEYLDHPKLIGNEVIDEHDGKIVPGDWCLVPPNNWDGESDYRGTGVWIFLPWECFSKMSSTQMPRWASRIMLKINSVKVERLKDATFGDVLKEGISREGAWDEHRERWDLKNKRAREWTDPWTVVVGFEVVKSKNGLLIK
jgi:hypothetical protein